MTSVIFYKRLTTTCCAILASSLIGCSSGGQAKEGERAVSTMAQVTQNITKAKTDVDRVTAALDKLSSGKDLKRAYEDYTRAVAELKQTADDAQKRGKDLRARRDQYLAKWEKEVAQTSNPDVRQSMEERQARVRANYDRIAGDAEQVRDAYQPFIKDAEDIQRALAMDLTPAGVQSMQPAISQAKRDSATLNQKLDALNNDLEQTLGRMSASGK